MSKNKKSYMESKNILDEGFLDSIIKAIIAGRGGQLAKMAEKNKKMKKAKIHKHIEKLNSDLDSFEKSVNQVFPNIKFSGDRYSFKDLVKDKD
tara:strand:- start:147 stop:425 length:279 start_codon:yes stop_codon:yes gene_type:complete